DLTAVYRREVDFTQTGPIEGLWDCTHVRGLIDNLLSNAFKYGDPDRDVSVHLESRGVNALLRVHNFGEAIASAELQAIFTPFYRSSHPRDAQQIGWGMGLSMVATLAHVNFGHVIVTSDTASGTTFVVSLPILHA
ncbi:MAG: ATP-binding protein, partial [Cytophagaceae bacterium]